MRTLAPIALLLALSGCTVNPATGSRQFNLIGETREIQIGRDSDRQIVAQYGLYADDEMQDYVAELGKKLAATSERPQLPWTFRVVDDPIVNAFALPGGFIYITRGILAHLNTESELVGVLGHEIGHVTARHGVNQMSKGVLVQVGAGVTAASGIRGADQIASAAQTGIGLLFLRHGRDDERQSDSLGFRYALRARYDPRSMEQVFETLERVGGATSGGQQIPGWLSTHPSPGNRRELLQKQIAGVDQALLETLRVERDSYLQRLDGLVYGDDPREGYFLDERFVQPELRFELRFPPGWKTLNLRRSVIGVSPEKDAVVELELVEQGDAETAATAFFESGTIVAVRRRRSSLAGATHVSYEFSIPRDSGGSLAGVVSFIEHRDNVYRVLGYCQETEFAGYRASLDRALDSFRAVDERRLLDVEPLRLRTLRLPAATTLRAWAPGSGSSVSLETLALINGVDADETLVRGRLMKTVEGRLPAP